MLANRNALLILAGSLGLVQAQAPPAFDVASVKLTAHGRDANGFSRSQTSASNGNFVATNASMSELIRWAYRIKEYQLVGPDWLNSDAASYDIAAKASPDTKQMPEMLQMLLSERFKLAVHRETRTLPVYDLVVGKTGAKLGEAGPEGNNNFSSSGGHLRADGSMGSLANYVAREVGRPVFDRTGLSGAFKFTLDYDRSGQDDTRPSIFTALQEQLGLRLEATKGPVEVLVVDHAEKVPTEN